MRVKPFQMTIFDWMLLVVVAAFGSKCLKTLWEIWQRWPEFISPLPISYELRARVFTECVSLGAVAALAALIIFFRNRWHAKKTNP